MPAPFHGKIVLAAWILAFAHPGFAQQSEQQYNGGKKVGTSLPETPTPKEAISVQPETVQLPEFASQLVQYADAVGCQKQVCELLVTDFLSPEGKISPYGIKLADDLAAEMA